MANYVFFIFFVLIVVVLKDLIPPLFLTKKEKGKIQKIKDLKEKIKIHPEKEAEINMAIYDLKFKNISFGLKSLLIRYGLIILSFMFIKKVFDFKLMALQFVALLIILNIIYKWWKRWIKK